MACRDYLVLGESKGPIVITCDSIGGIGELPQDTVKAPAYTVGRFLARVALMELMCAGASLEALSCTFSISEAAAAPILKGVFDEAKHLHPNPEKIMVMTTEKNVPTHQTGVGLTCIGRAAAGIRNGLSQPGDIVLGIGLPKVGDEVVLGDKEIMDIPALRELLNLAGVNDVVPAGSKGLLYEAEVLANSAGLRLEHTDNEILYKSAGPATAVVCSCNDKTLPLIQDIFDHITCIGILKEG